MDEAEKEEKRERDEEERGERVSAAGVYGGKEKRGIK